LKSWVEFFLDLLIVMLAALLIRAYVVIPFKVYGPSMCNTLNSRSGECLMTYGDRMIVNIFGYLRVGDFEIGAPKSDDIIIFAPSAVTQKFYVKRIIAVPGETVRIKDGYVYKKQAGEFVQLEEPYLSEKNIGNTLLPSGPTDTIYTVPEDHYFVMGDNRLQSTDSRNCFHRSSIQPCSAESLATFVARDQIKGKAWIRFWPLNKIELL
jgi:signal peptidase I